ncbi:MAG: endonuclease/exonuclease/phosphatase family protein [Chloroflexota bacterium]
MTSTPLARRGLEIMAQTGLAALTVVFGLQTLRVLLPLIVYHYGVRPGITSIDMGLYAFGTFLVAFLAAILRRLLGPQALLALTAGGLALLRLGEQLSPSPALDLTLTTAGTALFVLFLPTYLGHVRSRGAAGTGGYALALLLGLALDTGLHGALGTYDLSWQPGPGTALLVLVLVLIQLALLARALRAPESRRPSDAGFLATLPFLALGPFLFLQALLFQNIAHLTVATGWPQPAAFAWVVLANAAAVALATVAVGRARRGWWPGALFLGAVLILAPWMMSLGGWAGAVGLFLGQIGAAGELALILAEQGARADRPGLWRTSAAHGLGMILLVSLTFAYYVGYDLRVPYTNTILLPLAGVVLLACALAAAALLPGAGLAAPLDWRPAGVALAVLLLPLFSWAAWRAPEPVAGRGWPVRVMTYNLHQGFDTEGRLGMEALARVIEGSGAQVVALQEVSRGWYINGSLDMLVWLSRRLGMPYLFGPAADPVWGNAILSRYPIREHGSGPVPRGDAPMKRGYLWARIDLGQGRELLMIATHLHHVEEESQIRLPQVATIVKFWAGRERTVILGDMNSWPPSPEMALFRQAGLRDAFAEIGSGDGYTYASNKLYERIDYIWISPDLRVSDLAIPQSTASDHLGVVVTVGR